MKSRMSSTASGCRVAISVATSLCLLLAILLPTNLVECEEQLEVDSRQQKDSDDLADTIKYLEKLDKYFSTIARPRFGRSEFKQRARSIGRPTSMFGISTDSKDQLGRQSRLLDLLSSRATDNYANLNL